MRICAVEETTAIITPDQTGSGIRNCPVIIVAPTPLGAVCCGRMGPMCIPVYDIFEVFREKYPDIKFIDMEFDIPGAAAIRNLRECQAFQGLPFTVYYLNGEVVKATSSIQNPRQILAVIKEVFA